MERTPFDPRAICNLLLDEAVNDGISITNLALQKLLYFSHALHLIEYGKPLVSGYFEAWQYGPVHPSAYQAFKIAGERPIEFRAQSRNPLSGATTPLPPPSGLEARRAVRKVLVSYGGLSPGRLVDVSHAKGAPWHFVVEQARNEMAFGLRISENVILARFKYHKVSVGTEPNSGEPGEDKAFARN